MYYFFNLSSVLLSAVGNTEAPVKQRRQRVPKGQYRQTIRTPNKVASLAKLDVDSGPWGLCVVDAMNKFTQTVELLCRKRDGTATL